MLKVTVRFDKVEEDKAIKITGWAPEYPEVGQDFRVQLEKSDKFNKIVEFGKVFNIASHGDMLIVQTEFVVAEVWLVGGAKEERKVLPIKPNTLIIQGGKLYGRRKAGSVKGALSRLGTLIKLIKEDEAFYQQKPKPELRLLKE